MTPLTLLVAFTALGLAATAAALAWGLIRLLALNPRQDLDAIATVRRLRTRPTNRTR
ncbi:hypothetical protein PWG71_25470 [Nocardiopsis sp. N85]|uniref:hypothetical protein n=1 Tax=Nocardiopsis sp. N85 TaxID=3029400 RepID=UPI00237FBB08|nr:hypothetical protein [Nocardiopsis sp. N85]MDE3724750.1 hypothetical protein [Nocardiopsis sp. N85]